MVTRTGAQTVAERAGWRGKWQRPRPSMRHIVFHAHRIKMGFVPNMRVPCTFYVNEHLQQLLFEELEQFVSRGDTGGFLPAVKQLANVAALPGIVKASIALPDVHSGYGFAIGNVAAFDMSNPESIVSPGTRKRDAATTPHLPAACQ